MSLVLQLPAWVLDHPWTSAGMFVGGLLSFTALILLNPRGYMLRELFRRKK